MLAEGQTAAYLLDIQWSADVVQPSFLLVSSSQSMSYFTDNFYFAIMEMVSFHFKLSF